MDDYKYLFKVVLIGNASVGKTCLVRRFCQDVFPAGQAATIGVDFLIKTVEVNGEKIKVCIINLVIFSCLVLFLFSFKYGIQLVKNVFVPSLNHIIDQLMH
jgi:hypothetical protein